MKKTIVVVFYKQKIEDSKTFRSLNSSLFNENEYLSETEIILYDNSPDKQSFNADKYSHVNMNYVHDSRNLGIATAYNYAWSVAQQNKSEWLILFDHDTDVTKEYILKIMKLKELDQEIAAVVPKVNYEGERISPVYSHSLRPLSIEKPEHGIQEKPVMGINSGAMIRLHFINNINGFNKGFALDYLDHWLFYEIYARGYKVNVLDVTLEHELSVMDYSRVSLARYKSILESELNFYKHYKSDLLTAYRIQLAKRFLKQLLTVKNKNIAFYTLKRWFSI